MVLTFCLKLRTFYDSITINITGIFFFHNLEGTVKFTIEKITSVEVEPVGCQDLSRSILAVTVHEVQLFYLLCNFIELLWMN